MHISESIDKILQEGSVGKRFYDIFLTRYPEFKEFFSQTNMQRQSNLLISALVLAESHYTRPNEGFRAYLRHLGEDHQERGIAPEDYAKWKEAMLATLEDFHGADWTKELRDHWNAAIDKAVGNIIAGYSSN